MKKLNKLIAVVIALAVMAMMCAVSAFAATSDDAVDAVLTKRVETPKETTLKNGTFTFTFAQVTTDTNYSVETDAANIGDRTIEITAADKVNPVGDNDVYVDIAHLFADPASVKGSTNAKPFPHAGLYKYTVTETAGYTAADGETIHNSQAAYTVYISVANNEDKTDLIVTGVIVVKTANDDGSTTGGEVGEKADPLPGTGDDTKTEDETTTNVGSDWAFTNTYVKTLSTDPNGKDDPDDPTKDDNDAVALYVQKNLVDENDLADPDEEFTFDLSVYVPALAPEDSYVAEVWTVNGTKVADAEGFTAVKGTTTTDTVTLKAGQRLVFKSLPVGSKYTVSEQDPGDKYTVDTIASGTVNTAKTGVDETTITAADNYVRVTNTVDESKTTPTGILISNLPYIALALVAIGGLVAYVIVRRRNADEA